MTSYIRLVEHDKHRNQHFSHSLSDTWKTPQWRLSSMNMLDGDPRRLFEFRFKTRTQATALTSRLGGRFFQRERCQSRIHPHHSCTVRYQTTFPPFARTLSRTKSSRSCLLLFQKCTKRATPSPKLSQRRSSCLEAGLPPPTTCICTKLHAFEFTCGSMTGPSQAFSLRDSQTFTEDNNVTISNHII